MEITEAHRRLAGKFVFKDAWDEIPVTDSLLALVEYAYAEEEAALVTALRLAPASLKSVARRTGRPAAEIEPLLDSLSKRLLIGSATLKGIKVYSFLPLWPGVFETQAIRSRTEGGDDEYYKKFIGLFEDVYNEYLTWMKPKIEGRDVRIMRIIPIDRSIERVQGVMPLNTDRYSEIVERNASFCMVEVCACRQAMDLIGRGCGAPRDVCSAMGALADLVVEKGLGRRVSREEFMDAKTRAAEAGLVNLTDNLHDPLQVCSCCSCCCGVIRILKDHNIPTILARSHFEAAVDEEVCAGCESCEEVCPMDAITVADGKAAIDYARCIGCGLCVAGCDEKALSLREREGHLPPSENVFSYYSERYREVKGDTGAVIPRLTLGIGRLLGNDSRISVSGPRYKPKKT
jgi:Pyruvate/2-oxoacid:ferredoxin oxidoreductase delta subunit